MAVNVQDYSGDKIQSGEKNELAVILFQCAVW